MKALMILMLGLSASASANQSEINAMIYCKALNGTGLLSSPCQVNINYRSVDIEMNTNRKQARKICRGVALEAKRQGLSLAPGWQLRIYRATTDAQLARCTFYP